MAVSETSVKSALHYHSHGYASNWDINTYRGCAHKCIYCFAQYSHKYLESEHFFDDIVVKKNVATVLENDFSKRTWQGNLVNLCGVTDAYQPIEKEYQLMPDILKTFIKHQNPIAITTKSSLILRDIDLLDELNKITNVVIRISLTTLNENIIQKIEPFASPAIERINVIKEFSTRNIHTGILMMPIIPYLTDNQENIESIFQMAKENNVKHIIPQVLHLRGNTKKVFFSHAENIFPDIASKIKALYKGGYADSNYLKEFQEKIRLCRKKYNFYNSSLDTREIKKPDPQLDLL